MTAIAVAIPPSPPPPLDNANIVSCMELVSFVFVFALVLVLDDDDDDYDYDYDDDMFMNNTFCSAWYRRIMEFLILLVNECISCPCHLKLDFLNEFVKKEKKIE